MRNDGELVLRSGRFRAERQTDWRKLEMLLDRVEARGPSDLSDGELLALPGLYRSALASLSVARAITLDRALIAYLEDLAGRAYFFVYGSRSSRLQQVSRFFGGGWPSAVQRMIPDIAISMAVMLLAAVAAYLLVSSDPDWFHSMIPAELANGREPAATADYLRSTIFGGEFSNDLSVFATYLFTHNAGVSLLAFAVGFAFGLPTLLLMAYNGCTLGAFIAVFVAHGLGIEFAGWLLIHGITELLAIAIAGGAGLHIGRAMILPGNRTRLEAAAIAGRFGAQAMGGVIIMLLLASVLESVGRQTINDTNARFAIAGATAAMWAVYLFIPRRTRTDA